MSDTPQGGRPNRRIKPTLDTQFHIDYDWWERQDLELDAYILTLIPEDKREQFQGLDSDDKIDQIDPETAEVRQVDSLAQTLQEALNDNEFSQMPLVDAIFKVFLINGNSPLTPNELGEITDRNARTILRTLSGARVYRGLRPIVFE